MGKVHRINVQQRRPCAPRAAAGLILTEVRSRTPLAIATSRYSARTLQRAATVKCADTPEHLWTIRPAGAMPIVARGLLAFQRDNRIALGRTECRHRARDERDEREQARLRILTAALEVDLHALPGADAFERRGVIAPEQIVRRRDGETGSCAVGPAPRGSRAATARRTGVAGAAPRSSR
jgi:hypothetical protein